MQDKQYKSDDIHTRQERLNQAFRRAASHNNVARMEKLYDAGAAAFATNVAGVGAYDLAMEKKSEKALAFLDGILMGHIIRKKNAPHPSF